MTQPAPPIRLRTDGMPGWVCSTEIGYEVRHLDGAMAAGGTSFLDGQSGHGIWRGRMSGKAWSEIGLEAASPAMDLGQSSLECDDAGPLIRELIAQ